MKVKLKDGSRGSLRKRFIGNYYYEMHCLKREASVLKRPKDSKAWCPLSFSFEILFQ